MRINLRQAGGVLAVAVGLLAFASAAPAHADPAAGTDGTRVTAEIDKAYASGNVVGPRLSRGSAPWIASTEAEVDSNGRSTKDGATIMATGQIGSGLGSCPAGWFCVWWDYYFGGPGYGWSGSDSNWADNYFAGGYGTVDNDAGSYYNNGTACSGCEAVRVFDGAGYSAPLIACMPRYHGVPVSSNRGSSHSWYAGC